MTTEKKADTAKKETMKKTGETITVSGAGTVVKKERKKKEVILTPAVLRMEKLKEEMKLLKEKAKEEKKTIKTDIKKYAPLGYELFSGCTPEEQETIKVYLSGIAPEQKSNLMKIYAPLGYELFSGCTPEEQEKIKVNLSKMTPEKIRKVVNKILSLKGEK